MLYICFLRIQAFFLFLHVHPADITDGYDGTDDTYHTKRIGAGISQCDGVPYSLSGSGLLGGTQTRSIGYGTIENTYYHWQVYPSVNEVDAQCYCDIQ